MLLFFFFFVHNTLVYLVLFLNALQFARRVDAALISTSPTVIIARLMNWFGTLENNKLEHNTKKIIIVSWLQDSDCDDCSSLYNILGTCLFYKVCIETSTFMVFAFIVSSLEKIYILDKDKQWGEEDFRECNLKMSFCQTSGQIGGISSMHRGPSTHVAFRATPWAALANHPWICQSTCGLETGLSPRPAERRGTKTLLVDCCYGGIADYR